MSHQSASMMFVQASILDASHKAFQAYVKEYFKEQEIGGVRQYVAFRVLSLSHRYHRTPGVAPCHSVDVDYFGHEHGMSKGERLSDWIQQKLKDSAQGIIEVYASWDDGCIGSATYD